MSLFKRWLGAAPAVAAPVAQAVAVPSRPLAAMPVVVRAEIIDQRHRLCGYRFHAVARQHGAPLGETAMVEALQEARVPEFAAQRLALVPAVTFGRHLPLLAAHTVFLLDRRHSELPAEQLAGRMGALRESGAQLALRGVTLAAEEAPLLALCDMVLLYLNEHSLPAFQALIKQLRQRYPALKLCVDGLESWNEQRMCLSWGCDYFMGPFLTTRDEADSQAKVDQSRMTSIELLNLLRTEAELPALIDVVKRDPGMTYQLLQWANAPANGLGTQVTSLQQAFLVLGRNQLYRALTVSMFRLGASEHQARDESLLEVALTRARFLETCSHLPAPQRDELFLVGMLSLFDVLMGVPMAQLVGSMQLSEEVREVLLENRGPYGPYLMLALLFERDKVERALELAGRMGLDADQLTQAGQAAFHWAQEALHHTAAAS
ncbi:EAL and HDOD domain-containing protein [Duganella qianjiadongensis]|uniref:HDOD domain-containing protein n=1 Tax=Duganella qianjiadongensis TaxID=2692176 RepID=A0ABW9VSC9_9BURK|nr:HDOD domain-containing protein [Duganella qianjiadongensis]MYM41980.1 HDOD domain-containing protein [Duganella qianjiadongensis]